MLERVICLAALVSLAAACEKPSGNAVAALPGAAVAAPPAVQQGKALLDQGQLDAALAKLQELPDDPVGLYYQGVVHLRKAGTAPLPDAGFRDEDRLAVQALEHAVAAKPEFAAAHFTLAEILAPYTLKRYGPSPGARRRPVAAASDDPDISPERVAREYQAAVLNDKTSRAPIDALIRFARQMKRPDDAEPAYAEWIARDKEAAEPHLAYGDFLYAEKKDGMRAIEQYQLALIWTPQDASARDRICDIYLDQAFDHFGRRQWATAEARLLDAKKFLTAAGSAQDQRLRELQGKLAAIRR